MKDKKELLSEMEKAMDRYDLSKEIENAYIGEWTYGVAMVPCDWVYKYVAQPEVIKCTPNWFCAGGERRKAEDGE